jgi:hypothetical protein
MSPEFVLHWFLCDGACSVNRGSGHMMLCTDSFTRHEVEFLQVRLQSVGIESSLMNNRRIRVRQKSIGRFYEYIGESPVKCLAYKWIPVANRRSRQADLKHAYQEIHDLYANEGWPCSKIAKKFQTNYFSIRYILKSRFGLSFGKNAATETTCREGMAPPQRLHAGLRRKGE